MKKLLITICLFSFINCTNQKDEQEAILKVIEAENVAFSTNKDRLAWASYWHISPDSRWWFTGLDYFEYWKEGDFKKAISAKAIPPVNNGQNSLSDLVVKVNRSVAWATFDRKEATPDGKAAFTHDVCLLEKINNEWKIVSYSIHQYNPK